jgi:hypothetical protein
MAKGNKNGSPKKQMPDQKVSASTDDLLLAALERGGDTSKTGRFLITFKEGATQAGMASLKAEHGLRVASAADFDNHAMVLEDVGDADAAVFPEIGVALVGSGTAVSRGMTAEAFVAEDSPVHSIDPEYFMFAVLNPADYMKGVMRAAFVAEGIPVHSSEYSGSQGESATKILSSLCEIVRPQSLGFCPTVVL